MILGTFGFFDLDVVQPICICQWAHQLYKLQQQEDHGRFIKFWRLIWVCAISKIYVFLKNSMYVYADGVSIHAVVPLNASTRARYDVDVFLSHPGPVDSFQSRANICRRMAWRMAMHDAAIREHAETGDIKIFIFFFLAVSTR